MFTITEAAAQLIEGQMEAAGEGEMCLRVFIRPGADGMQFGMSRANSWEALPALPVFAAV